MMRAPRSSSANPMKSSDLSPSRRLMTHCRPFHLGRFNKAIRRSLNRIISVALVLAILCPSMPAAPQVIVGLASEWKTSFLFWLESSGVKAKVTEWVTGEYRPTPQEQEGQDERDFQVSRVQIYPGDVTVKEGQTVAFAAVAYDYQDSPVGGVRFRWSGHDAGRGRPAHVSRRGDFKARAAGTYTVTAEAMGQQAQVTVTVTEGERREPGEQKQGTPATKQVSSRDMPAVASASKTKGAGQQGALSNSARASRFAKASLSHAPSSAPSAPLPLPAESYYDDGNYWSADDPGNQVGDTPGGPQDGGAGSGNFQLTAPVLSLPGRGMDISLGLAYNSRLWNKAGSEISYDIDRGWPAPGWNLGFGKLLGMGVYNGGMIVEPDGTRRPYTGTITFGPNQNYTDFVGHTTDGSFIDYTYHSGIGGAITNAQVKYPNGTVVDYWVQGTGAVYPTRVTDAQGNYITITYVNNTGPHIQTVTDTLGRVINFHYDTNNLLTAVTAPGLTAGTTRTLVRLHYKHLTLNYAFSGLTPRVTNPTPWVIDAIYYPATSTGYWFNDTDSYSSYGMIARVREQRGMTHSASSLIVQGTMTKGTESSESAYAYPLTPNASLTDAPTYPSRTDTWDGMDTTAAVTEYLVQQNATPRRVEITLPDESRSVQLSHNTPGQFTDGLVYQDETYDVDGTTLLRKNTVAWEQGAYESPRPARTEVINEQVVNGPNKTTAAEFDYGTAYNQVTEVRDYDYGGVSLLRITRTDYENSTAYTSRHIFNLVKQVEIFQSNGTTRASRTEYTYDGATLADAPAVTQHDVTHNPYAPEEEICDWMPDPHNPGFDIWVCYNYNPYQQATAKRGNVTQVKTYSDAAGLTGAITETRRYDITGNLISASTSCCEQTSYTYTSATQYAYPTTKKRGSATVAAQQVTTSVAYNFNTGLIISATDANGRTTQTAYLATSLRPDKITLPTGAFTSYTYDDAAMTLSETVYHAGGTVIAAKTVRRLNGMGQVVQEEALTRENNVDYWDVVETQYDKLERVWKQSRPYRSGQAPQWSETTYDGMGRVTRTLAPDGSASDAFYNETARPSLATTLPGETMRTVDAWGKERWGRADASGRLVEVVEPDPLGNGLVQGTGAGTATLPTRYYYDTLGNLTQVVQGSQQRNFKYDSLGRLTHQKLAEASATLNDAGTYVTSGGVWSDVFAYDERSNLISRTDARGVKTIFNYNNDPLNRLQSVTYDTTGFGDTTNPILAAPSVNYSYMTTGDRTRLNIVTTAGVSTEDYDYDAEGRLKSVLVTLTSRPSYSMDTDYIYDTLNRVVDVRYPAQYGVLNNPRKLVHHDYDVAGRVSGLKVNNVSHASSIAYNPASQVTSMIVGTGANPVTESYSYEAQSGLLSNQKVLRGATTLLDLTYSYLRTGTTGGRTAQLTKITNNLDGGRSRAYEYDALGRLKKATGGPAATPTWTQNYSYDRWGNRTGVTATGTADNGSAIPADGFAALTYTAASNRISTAGWQYDAAGNQTRAKQANDTWLRYQYDAANRLVKVKTDNQANPVELASYTYGSSNQRLISEESGLTTYYAWAGGSVIAEYGESAGQTAPQWMKSYVYLGGRLLSTITPGATAEVVEYQHEDRLGTRLVTNNANTNSFEQAHLPFGTSLDAESTGATNRRFTSYDRSQVSGLDYAVNRFYAPHQGRFNQVDPIGMSAADLSDPQTLNMYAYCGNDPINRTDPSGLFFGWLKKLFKRIFNALVKAVIAAVVAFVTSGFNWGAAAAAGVSVFLMELGWQRANLRRLFGRTPQTFPANGLTLSQILQGTTVGRILNPDPKNYLTRGWNPNAYHPLLDDCSWLQIPLGGNGMYAKSNSPRSKQFTRVSTFRYLALFARDWRVTGHDKLLRIGETSVNGGGPIAGHSGEGHRNGFAIDIGLFRYDSKDTGTTINERGVYDQATTRDLVEHLLMSPDVTKVMFADSYFEGRSKYVLEKKVHDNHVHAEFKNPC